MEAATLTIRNEQPEASLEPSTEMPACEYDTMYRLEDDFWWYRGMRHHLLVALSRRWNWRDKPFPRILDAGCGTGGLLQRLIGGLGRRLGTNDAYGLDISSVALDFCRRRGLIERVALGSITAMPFPAHHFDIVVSFDVLCDVIDVQAGFDEMARVLRPGGLAVVSLPAYQWLYSEHDRAVNNRQRFGRRTVAQHVAGAGLQIEHIGHVNTLLFAPAALMRLLKRRKISHKMAGLRSDLAPLPSSVNGLLTQVIRAEAELLRMTGLSLPFGLSILTLARKV
jgi:SAM-dependent methyltransferase